MSTTTAPPDPVAAATTAAIDIARDAPTLVAGLEASNPAMAAQLTGSLATYAKSGAAPIVGMIVGTLAAHYGLACTAVTAATGACWSQEVINNVTYALIGLGASAGALVMHWISKWPARRVLAATTVQGTPK